jgi:hypothetical protein
MCDRWSPAGGAVQTGAAAPTTRCRARTVQAARPGRERSGSLKRGCEPAASAGSIVKAGVLDGIVRPGPRRPAGSIPARPRVPLLGAVTLPLAGRGRTLAGGPARRAGHGEPPAPSPPRLGRTPAQYRHPAPAHGPGRAGSHRGARPAQGSRRVTSAISCPGPGTWASTCAVLPGARRSSAAPMAVGALSSATNRCSGTRIGGVGAGRADELERVIRFRAPPTARPPPRGVHGEVDG